MKILILVSAILCGAGLGVDGVTKAEVYDKSDHTIRFMVKGFPGDSPYSNNYWDGYPDMIWEKHLKKDIDPMIKTYLVPTHRSHQ